MPRKKAETSKNTVQKKEESKKIESKKTPKTTTKKTTKKNTTKNTTKKKTTPKVEKMPLVSAQIPDIENVIRYLKCEPTSENYNKYITPMVKQKGKKYADRLIGSTIIVFKERGISLDDITFDENDNITVVKRLNQ